MKPSALSQIFAPELHRRLQWFVRLRWLAVVGIAAVGLFVLVVDPSFPWVELEIVALLVGAYNLVFWMLLRSSVHVESPPRRLARTAVAQVILDLTAVLVVVHLTGGWSSPMLAFLAFHMTLGTILLSTRTMVLVACGVTGAVALLFALEERGLVPAGWSGGATVPHIDSWLVTVGALAILLVGVVYLTDSVMQGFTQRTVELHDASQALAEHTTTLEGLLVEKEELQRQKSHYLRISAHQLRSPLATVRTAVDVMRKGYIDPASEQGGVALDGIAARVDELLEIVNDLLELAKIREGRKRAPWVRNVSVSQILADIFDAMDGHAEAHKVTLVPSFITETAIVLDWGVPPDLVYAFENLIDNAIKYAKPEGGTVTVSQRFEGDSAVLSVADDGIGIPEELQGDVFLEFVRAPNAKHHTAQGTGLGMPIVREAIQMHGGEVSLTSVEGEGTTVDVRLPLHWTPNGLGSVTEE